MPNSVVYVRALQTFTGDPGKIAGQLRSLSELLQSEVDKVGQQIPFTKWPGSVNASEYAALVSKVTKLLADTLNNAGTSFRNAASSKGSPEHLRSAYAAVLSDIAAARIALDEIVPPESFLNTQTALQSLLASFYHQLAAWPRKILTASDSVSGNKLDLELSAAVDMAPFESAFAEESKTL
jgi:hypothetical protein